MRTFRVLRHTPDRPTARSLVRQIAFERDAARDAGRTGEPNVATVRSLNIGSSSVRLPGDSVNLDVVDKPDVDVVGDAHDLSMFDDGSFDLVVMEAVLQHLRAPRRAVEEAVRVLRPGGILFIDAPFVQPYCHDQFDLHRFSGRGLEVLVDGLLDDVRVAPSIAGAAALAFYLQKLLDVGPRWFSYALRLLASIPLGLFALTQFNQSPVVAGAFWLTGRKR